MYAEPQTLTISTVAVSLPRISMGELQGRFRTASGDLELSIAHSVRNRERSVIRLDRNKVGADPLDSGKSKAYKAAYYLVVDAPNNGVGFTDTELEADIKGLLTLLQTTGYLAKFLGKES